MFTEVVHTSWLGNQQVDLDWTRGLFQVVEMVSVLPRSAMKFQRIHVEFVHSAVQALYYLKIPLVTYALSKSWLS